MVNILLAEDDESTRIFLKNALEKAGHTVCACKDGLEGERALLTQNYDLLLTDIVMPGMDGIELSKHARKKFPQIKVMMITGFAAMAAHETDQDGQRTMVISKPFHLHDVIREVDKLLASKE